MIIWRGWGIVVVFIMGISIILGDFVFKLLGGVDSWTSNRAIGFLIFLVSAGLTYLFNTQLDNKTRHLLDTNTNEKFVYTPSNDLFFIPVKYWVYINIIIAVSILIF